MERNYSTDEILKKARELSSLLRQHPASLHYFSLLREMNDNEEAQELLNRLVTYGKDLNEKIARGEYSPEENTPGQIPADHGDLPLVKDFINAQKKYLALVHAVMDKVENPDNNAGSQNEQGS